MKILTRYTLKEFLPPFFLALVCFTSLLLLDEIFRLTKLFVRKGVSPEYLIKLLIYILPATLVVTIPMATLVGILLALGRFASDNEITAMRAHGVSFYQILLPLLLVSLMLSVTDLFFMDRALPRGNAAYAALKRDISMRNSAVVLEEGVAMKELEREGKIWMFESMDAATGRLQNVKVWDAIWVGKPRLIQAKTATIGFEDGQGWLTLYDGMTYEPVTGAPEAFRITEFAEDRIALDFSEVLERSPYEHKSPRLMSIAELKRHIETLRVDTPSSDSQRFLRLDQQRYAQVEYYKKFSIPFACLVFGLIGVPLGLMVKRSGKMVGFGIGLGLILVYYLLLQIGQDTGRNGFLPPVLAMWLPNIVIGVLGVGFAINALFEGTLRRSRTEAGVRGSGSGARVTNPDSRTPDPEPRVRCGVGESD